MGSLADSESRASENVIYWTIEISGFKIIRTRLMDLEDRRLVRTKHSPYKWNSVCLGPRGCLAHSQINLTQLLVEKNVQSMIYP